MKESRGIAGAVVRSAVDEQLPVVIHEAASFLLEIGVEELPAGDVDSAIEQLQTKTLAWLGDLRLEHGEVIVAATPRRLSVHVAGLAAHQEDREDIVKGPPSARAFDAQGQPTKAAEGFARGKGVDVSALEVREIDGGSYVVAVVKQTGKPAAEVLAEALPGFVAGIKFEKSMRWNESGVAFSRPIRWIVSLMGDQVIPFEYAGVVSGRVTRGLRPYDSPEMTIPSADAYFSVMDQAGILIDSETRKREIMEQVKQTAAVVGGEALIETGLLNEVTNLVEKPTAVLGGINPDFLALPRDVLISVMKKHQRYFPVEKDGKLLPYFIAVRNGDAQHVDLVRQGNEHVLGARFADANFFVREDVKNPLEHYRPGLSTLIFQAKLGSMLDKANRIEKLAAEIAPMLGVSGSALDHTLRAAHLAKADLATQMVVEMTSLQGVIGREYALRSGEAADVAVAIGEQYQTVPQTVAGVTVALSDRLDSLVGLFAAGLAPSGAKDPFGLRRAAIGVVQPLIEHQFGFDLRSALVEAAKLQPLAVDEAVQQQVLDFISGRLRVLLIEAGSRYDVVDAVLAAQSDNPAGAAKAVRALSAWVAREDWGVMLPGYARCVRITRDQKQRFEVDPAFLSEKEEKDLFAALGKAEDAPRQAGSVDDFLNAFVPMIPVINRFFDVVLVMAEEPQVRANRLGMLQRIAALASGVADLSLLEGF